MKTYIMTGSTGIIIQARLSSTRLPGKVLMPFFEGRSILDIQLEKLKKLDYPIILATTDNKADDRLVKECLKHDIEIFRGSEQNVLERFISCAEQFNFSKVIRVCSDNPFLDVSTISDLIGVDNAFDYVSFRDHSGIAAIKTHWGTFVEFVSVEALSRVARLTQDNIYREHVTNYVYQHPSEFRVELLDAPSIIYSRDDLRFTVDTIEDFENMQNLYQKMINANRTFTLENLVLTVDESPEILSIMKEGIGKFKK